MSSAVDFSKAVIAGVGETEFSKESGKTERELAVIAISKALEEAGLTFSDVDGLCSLDLDSNDAMLLSSDLQIGPLTWFSKTSYGGGLSCAAIQDAALAVANGLANVVVVYRAANMYSKFRYGKGEGGNAQTNAFAVEPSRVGLFIPSHIGAMWFQQYLETRGIDNRMLGEVVVWSRRYAANNPQAFFYENNFTIEDYLDSDWAVEPTLRIPDCCQETDGGVAIVVTRSGLGDPGFKPVKIAGAARGMSKASSILQHFNVTMDSALPDLEVVLAQLWQQTGLSASDLDVAMIYDAFSPFIYMALESMGIARGNEAFEFVRDGGIGPDGEMPINPNGGQLSAAYIHGFNGVVEGVKQLRGTAINQISSVEHVLATGGPALPTSGIIMSAQ